MSSIACVRAVSRRGAKCGAPRGQVCRALDQACSHACRARSTVSRAGCVRGRPWRALAVGSAGRVLHTLFMQPTVSRERCARVQPCHTRCVRDWPAVLLGRNLENIVATRPSRDSKISFFHSLDIAFRFEHSHRRFQNFGTEHQGHSRPQGTKTTPLDEF